MKGSPFGSRSFGYIPVLWYEGYKDQPEDKYMRTCPCSAHTYERQRRRLIDHVRARG